MATPLPPGKRQFLDANGAPLADGLVYYYVPSTSTPKDTWTDQAQTTLNINPVELDGDGYAVIWGAGAYRELVKDSDGNTIWDQVTTAEYDPPAELIPCTATGKNTIALTPVASLVLPLATTYQNHLTVMFVVAQTNDAAVQAQYKALGNKPVYVDNLTGPAALTGSEMIAGALVLLSYDTALNSGGGGWHLTTMTGVVPRITMGNAGGQEYVRWITPAGDRMLLWGSTNSLAQNATQDLSFAAAFDSAPTVTIGVNATFNGAIMTAAVVDVSTIRFQNNSTVASPCSAMWHATGDAS